MRLGVNDFQALLQFAGEVILGSCRHVTRCSPRSLIRNDTVLLCSSYQGP